MVAEARPGLTGLEIGVCGDLVALGIKLTDVEAFDAAEVICDRQYPGCGCPTGPMIAEDGEPAFDPDDIDVECVEGSGMTFVP